MASLEQLFNLVKQLNEKYNLLVANAKKTEELPEMETMNSESLIRVSEQVDGVWVSKFLEIQKIIDGLSLSGQDNKVREVILGSITEDHDLNYLLDNQGITVTETEIVVLTALVVINNQLLQRQFLWKLGKGEFNPIGSTDINTKVLELQPKFLNEITSDELTNSPIAIVYDFGIITDPILDVLNTASPARDYSDDTRIYYVRATLDGVKLLYNFIGTNGIYGDGELQMTEDDLVLVYSSQNVDISTLLNSKLDTGGYSGTAQTLNNRIDNLENYGRTVFQDAWIDVDDAGVVSDLNLSTTDSLSLNFIGTVSELQSIIYDSGVAPPYRGSVGFIKNSQAIDILIPYNELSLVSGRFVWKTPDEQDLVLKPKQILQFKTNGISSGYLEVVTVSNASIDESNIMHLDGDEEVDGNKTFLQPVSGEAATNPEHLVTKAQLDLKLDASAYNDRYKGKYTSLANLETAHPTASSGDYAQVDAGSGSDVVNYNWDDEEGWVVGSSGSGATDTDALPEGSTNFYFTESRVLATILSGLSAVSGTFTATDSILTAMGKIKYLIDNIATTYQAILVSGTNIKTINGSSILGSGDIDLNVLYAPKSIPVVQIGTNTTLDDTYNGKVILLTASCTITLPNGLATNFGVTIATKASCTLTLATGGSVTLLNNAGTSMAEKLSCTLLNTGTANEYLTAGNL